ncbi:Rio2 [Fragilaria crotonensis]|nr:Rio2 [Fragilaria crotonensis]
MKLDPTVLRNMNRQDFRVLAAVETGMKSHELVPAPLIASIANLRHGGSAKVLSTLLRDKLLSHDRSCGYDGYRLTTSGYDIMALENLKARGIVAALGDKIGTGKESDVYLAATPDGKQVVLKFHRLGRTSFRDVKKKRDYFNVNAVSKNRKGVATFHQQPNSWLFLSRISALKEYAFMKALHEVGYPTPQPVGHNRHIVAMGLVRGVPLYQVHVNRVSAEQAESIFQQSTALASRLGAHGLVHCDLNEFNLMVDLSGIQNTIAEDNDVAEHYVRHSGMSVVSQGALSAHGPLQKHQFDGTGEIVTEAPPEPKEFLENGEPKPTVTLIDFPQMVSTRHPNAKELYDRDLNCLKRFFVTKLKCVPEQGWDELIPKWEDVIKSQDGERIAALDDESTCEGSKLQVRLDEELQASGYSENDSNRDMELYYYHRDPARGLCQIRDVEEEDSDQDDRGDEEGSVEGGHDVAAEILESQPSSYPGLGTEVPDIDDDSIESEKGMAIPVFNLLDDEQRSVFTSQTRAMAEEKARARVRMHLEERKKKSSRKSAFQSRNNNKTFVKGKRVYDDLKF